MQPPFKIQDNDDLKRFQDKTKQLIDDIYRKMSTVDTVIDLNIGQLRPSSGTPGTGLVFIPDHVHDVGSGDGGDLALYVRWGDLIVNYDTTSITELSTTLTASTASTSKILTRQYRLITLYWDVTAITGTWLIKLRAYDQDEVQSYDVWMSDPITTAGEIRRSLIVEDPKMDVYIEELESGSITCTTKYYMRD